MKIALVNPPWTSKGTWWCREPHLPLEYGYAHELLERAGHDAAIFDAHFFRLTVGELCEQVAEYRPDMTIIATAPSPFSWHCPAPEWGGPQLVVASLGDGAGKLVAVGPHGSTSPQTTIDKLGVDVVVLGDCEEALVELAGRPAFEWSGIEGIAYAERDRVVGRGGPRVARLDQMPALRWGQAWLANHAHHHHRFDEGERSGPGAEIEASRGSVGGKQSRRDPYRKRRFGATLDELDDLVAQGVSYVYFVDEVFLPERPLLEELAGRAIAFGMRTRIDLWDRETLDLLACAGCVSVDADVPRLDDRALLVHAKGKIPFVQANLIDADDDEPAEVSSWRAYLRSHGIWTQEPASQFQAPCLPRYSPRWRPRGEQFEPSRA